MVKITVKNHYTYNSYGYTSNYNQWALRTRLNPEGDERVILQGFLNRLLPQFITGALV